MLFSAFHDDVTAHPSGQKVLKFRISNCGSDGLFLFLQPAQLSSKESTLVWIAVNEDGVSILDHHTMVCEGKAGSTLLKHLSYLPCSGLRGLYWPWSSSF